MSQNGAKVDQKQIPKLTQSRSKKQNWTEMHIDIR